ncbi:hypothetical protein GCM10010211_65170 [Streptomyces albospinus]|uniref:Uncharacterized protein n=1 Tax=Streptomyces albospinus TaxID=285515 RepID=A0ABQ2VLA6_9ACTN|nr:hypothetical protein GCM10010211_65170 [Streptomyces albospinus]
MLLCSSNRSKASDLVSSSNDELNSKSGTLFDNKFELFSPKTLVVVSIPIITGLLFNSFLLLLQIVETSNSAKLNQVTAMQ